MLDSLYSESWFYIFILLLFVLFVLRILFLHFTVLLAQATLYLFSCLCGSIFNHSRIDEAHIQLPAATTCADGDDDDDDEVVV